MWRGLVGATEVRAQIPVSSIETLFNPQVDTVLYMLDARPSLEENRCFNDNVMLLKVGDISRAVRSTSPLRAIASDDNDSGGGGGGGGDAMVDDDDSVPNDRVGEFWLKKKRSS